MNSIALPRMNSQSGNSGIVNGGWSVVSGVSSWAGTCWALTSAQLTPPTIAKIATSNIVALIFSRAIFFHRNPIGGGILKPHALEQGVLLSGTRGFFHGLRGGGGGIIVFFELYCPLCQLF